MKAPESIDTERLQLRRPDRRDAEEVFSRYAGDVEVTTYLGWPRHASVEATCHFIDISDAEWEQWPAGPYLVILRDNGRLLGATGLTFETPYRASTGYVLARDAWGQGFATEALHAMVDLAAQVGIRRLYALCHPRHRPSQRVLEKGGFDLEATLRSYCEFPNMEPGVPADVLCYARILGAV